MSEDYPEKPLSERKALKLAKEYETITDEYERFIDGKKQPNRGR